QNTGWEDLLAHQQIGSFVFQATQILSCQPEDHRRQHPDDRTDQVKRPKKVSYFTRSRFIQYAGIALHVRPVPSDKNHIIEPEGNHKPEGVLLVEKIEKPIRSAVYEAFHTAHRFKSQRHNNDYRRGEHNELQHVGYDNSQKSAGGSIKNGHDPKQDNGVGNWKPGGHIHQTGHRVQKSPAVSKAHQQKHIGVKFLNARPKPPVNEFGGGQHTHFLPARGNEIADQKSTDCHGPLNYDRYPPMFVGNGAPYHKGSRREETHVKR